MRQAIFFTSAIIICLSCSKQNAAGGEVVEIYLLKTSQTFFGKCQIDPTASALEDAAVIKNNDILFYFKSSHEFKLSNEAFQKVKTFLGRTPFAVTVDKQVIYYGFFMPSIMSSSCDHSITMDIAWPGDNKVVLRLGYPGLPAGATIDDQRNNSRLLATLKAQDKLR